MGGKAHGVQEDRDRWDTGHRGAAELVLCAPVTAQDSVEHDPLFYLAYAGVAVGGEFPVHFTLSGAHLYL